MPRDTIKSLKAEIDELRQEIAAIRAHVGRMPQHDPFKPIGPRRDAIHDRLFPEPRTLPMAQPKDELSRIERLLQ